MKPNPLNVEFFLLGQDVVRGDLKERRFTGEPHPTGEGSRLYRLGAFGLHSAGLWLEEGETQVLYCRSLDQFYRTSTGHFPPDPPANAKPNDFWEGFSAVYTQLLKHEAWIHKKHGAGDRLAMLTLLPHKVKKDRELWEELFYRPIIEKPGYVPVGVRQRKKPSVWSPARESTRLVEWKG